MHCLINQFVTETVHSFDFDRGSGLFEFAAQIFDLRINEMEIIGLIDMIPPIRLRPKLPYRPHDADAA